MDGTHVQPTTQTHRILTVDPTAFADVCFHAGWFRPLLKMVTFKS